MENSDNTSLALLQVDDLRLGYGKRVIVENVNFTVRAGEFWFLIGVNGKGKSTFLKGLLGLLKPQQGRYILHPRLESRQSIGFVPQTCGFTPSLPISVREFVLLGLVGTDATERIERLQFALAQVGLQGMEKHDYWSLSGGQQQRVRVARALIRRPTFLVMDEPTSGLDLIAETALLEDLARLNRVEHLTILFVSHSISIAMQYGTHVALFHEGIVQAGTVQELLNPQQLRQVYGMAVTNFR